MLAVKAKTVAGKKKIKKIKNICKNKQPEQTHLCGKSSVDDAMRITYFKDKLWLLGEHILAKLYNVHPSCR